MTSCISICLLFAVFITFSTTVSSTRIPTSKHRTQHHSTRKPAPVAHGTTLSTQVRIPVHPESSSECMNWPAQRLEDLCVPVVQCMCAVVADKIKIDEMMEACATYGDITDDICDSTREAKCFWLWWMGEDDFNCYNLVRDCIPYMFEQYKWKIDGKH